MTWYPIFSREQSTMADTWTEYLCATREGDKFDLGICAPELLGYIPREWFDEDDEPLPEYRDEYGSLLVPTEFEGRSVVGHDGEYLLGPLVQCDNERSASVSELSLEALSEALRQMEWDPEDASKLLAALPLLKGD